MKNFNDIYEKVYKQCAIPMEEMRKEVKKGYINVIAIAVIVASCFGIYVGHLITGICIVIFSLAFAIAAYYMFSKKPRSYNQFFKDNVIKTFVKEYSETLEYMPNIGLPELTYRRRRI